MAEESNSITLSTKRGGRCPHCSAVLNFSEEDRMEGASIVCPKCKKTFKIGDSEETTIMEQPKKKNGKGCLITIFIFIVLVSIGFIVNGFTKQADDYAKSQPKYEVGQAISGESMEEISSKWVAENDKSSVKGDSYLESLKGLDIVWIGEVEDVSNYKVYYIFSDTENKKVMKVIVEKGPLGLNNYAYIDVSENQAYIDLNKGTLIKITGKIAGFNQTGVELMLSPEIEKATIEVVNP